MKNLLCFLLLSSYSLSALSWGKKDFKDEIISPFDEEAKYFLIGGSAVTAAALFFEEEIDRSQDEVVDHKPLGDLSNWGDMAGQLVPNALYVITNSVLGYRGDSEGYRRALGMFKATAYAGGVTTALKYAIQEPRPHDHSQKNSFPSGHSTTVFAFSGYVWAEHGWKWGVPAMALATLTGISRIHDNKHRFHDVTAGATIGLAFGWGIQRLQKQTGNTVSIAPIYNSDAKGLAVNFEY